MRGFSWLHLRARRCLYLLIAMVLFLLVLAFTGESRAGQLLVGIFNLVMLVAAVGAVARTRIHLTMAALLAIPTVVLMVLAVRGSGVGWILAFYAVGAAFYLLVIIELMQYVLRRDRITADKLYGAVAIYIMIAVLWALFYGLLGRVYPGAFAVGGIPTRLGFADLVYFSFTVLTTSGFGDITAVLMPARFVAIFEQITGVMYVAILIARLAGVYPIPRRGD